MGISVYEFFVPFLLSETIYLHVRDHSCGFFDVEHSEVAIGSRSARPVVTVYHAGDARRIIDPRIDREAWTYAVKGAEIAGSSGGLSRAVAPGG